MEILHQLFLQTDNVYLNEAVMVKIFMWQLMQMRTVSAVPLIQKKTLLQI